jgi:IS30 family transposase
MAHKQLKANDRYTINKLLDAGTNQAEIVRIIWVNASTISREIKRNTAPDFKGVYNHLVANKLSADRKIASKSTPALDQITEEIEAEIIEKLKLGEIVLNFV